MNKLQTLMVAALLLRITAIAFAQESASEQSVEEEVQRRVKELISKEAFEGFNSSNDNEEAKLAKEIMDRRNKLMSEGQKYMLLQESMRNARMYAEKISASNVIGAIKAIESKVDQQVALERTREQGIVVKMEQDKEKRTKMKMEIEKKMEQQ